MSIAKLSPSIICAKKQLITLDYNKFNTYRELYENITN